MAQQEYDVIVIGGGITGAGVARDCSMRGLKTLLLERQNLADGATGRNHGMLHSGARYAVTDAESAEECIKENMILRRIAHHCVEEHDGLFISLPEDDLNYQQKFVESCRKAGIRADVLDPEEAKRLEPAVNPAIVGAVRVPDGSVDPFRLTLSNVADAINRGADVLKFHEVIGLIIENGRVLGVKARNNLTGEVKEIRARITVNAAGIWGCLIAKMAGVTINMFPAKGSLLVFGHRVNNMLINRCRKPANADILVPGDAICVIGTTSDRVPIESVDDMRVTPEEVNILLTEGAKLAPALATTRILRAYAGVRPLVASDDDPTGRSISRGIVCLDHEERDGLAGMITITGGKLMTYRLMAEIATNKVCEKLGVEAICETASTPLPGSESEAPVAKEGPYMYLFNVESGRHGCRQPQIERDNDGDRALVCECEEVSVGEVKYAVEHQGVNNLIQLRQCTRVGMGTCQGGLCAMRAACLMGKLKGNTEEAQKDLHKFLQERWKGMMPVGWGQTLSEAQMSAEIFQGLCGLKDRNFK